MRIMLPTRQRLVPIALVAVLLCAACSGGSHAPAPATPSAASGAPAATGPALVTGRAPIGVIVTLAPIAPRDVPLPEGPAVMDQYSKLFLPPLLLARVGQPVDFLNSDEVGHNVIVNRRPAGISIFSTSIDPREKYTHIFDQPGEYAVSCDLHPGMLATVYVTAMPFAATPDEGGTFTMPNVPPGPYTLTAVTPDGKATERRVEITPGRAVLDPLPSPR